MKSIIFKIWKYPLLSETFVTSQIITAINCGYDVKIVVREVFSIEDTKQINLFEKYEINDKIIIEDYRIPQNKVVRVLKWLYLGLVNMFNITNVIRYYKNQKTFSLTWLYQYNFYKQFNTSNIFHIQYGTNKSPIDILKKSGCLNTSIIVSFHGHDAFFPINGFIQNDNYYKDLFNVANAVIANTPYLAKQIKNIGCDLNKIKTIPISVNTDFFYPKVKQKKTNRTFKIISVGRLAKVKGHIFALKAVKKLKEKGCDVSLTIVGKGEERKVLSKFIRDNNISQIAELVGAKSQTEIRQLLWESDLFLFTSITLEGGRAETQGLATIEAQACGLPVVAFKTGGVPYTLKENITGYLCEEFDYECMAERIQYLMNKPEVLNKMKVNAVTFIEKKYAKKIIDEKWRLLYKQIIDNE